MLYDDRSALLATFTRDHAHDTDAELAAALVETAGAMALRMRDEGLTTDQKTSISDVVTDADRAAEEFVAGALEALRPDDGLMGEEGANKASTSGRFWVIDPVDGTYNFASGSDYFCSAVALVDGEPDAVAATDEPNQVLVGAVHRPVLGTTWLASEGVATRNGQPLPQLEPTPLHAVALATYLHPRVMMKEELRDAWMRASSKSASVRMFGAGSVDLSIVAHGGIGGWLQHSVPAWDWLPGKALVEAVGGRAIKADAGGVTWSVAGNSQLVREVADALRATD
ncbi:inositol monophosphatase family protein [Corynebacterium aquatimens]|uniref:Fructose-1,6-bisphosphatase/inositol monophosphatase family enzyme n=1 Tax=Corynebacterium aquatimens TaxID=1190508 RepID=A0A931E1X0_9CORY|nr:inositol monophosphatase family protein [Corynebacterium aquatimens]MBG6123244.1 fructose-1,6-bisphosphatase/inositol monophosphatase family enzyme [Corynebacterium aquatimens]